MKKLIVSVLTMLWGVGLITGCNSNNDESNTTTVKESSTTIEAISSTEDITSTVLEEVTNEEGFYIHYEDLNNISVYKSDINHDGVKESIKIDLSVYDSQQPAYLYINDSEGKKIYSEELYEVHMGNTSYSLCTVDNEDYILQYTPYLNQGGYSFSYELYSLDNEGKRVVKEKNEIGYSIEYTDLLLDVDEITGFFNKVEEFFNNGKLIISTLDFQLIYNKDEMSDNSIDIYAILDQGGNVAGFSSDDPLSEKINKINSYIEAN